MTASSTVNRAESACRNAPGILLTAPTLEEQRMLIRLRTGTRIRSTRERRQAFGSEGVKGAGGEQRPETGAGRT